MFTYGMNGTNSLFTNPQRAFGIVLLELFTLEIRVQATQTVYISPESIKYKSLAKSDSVALIQYSWFQNPGVARTSNSFYECLSHKRKGFRKRLNSQSYNFGVMFGK